MRVDPFPLSSTAPIHPLAGEGKGRRRERGTREQSRSLWHGSPHQRSSQVWALSRVRRTQPQMGCLMADRSPPSVDAMPTQRNGPVYASGQRGRALRATAGSARLDSGRFVRSTAGNSSGRPRSRPGARTHRRIQGAGGGVGRERRGGGSTATRLVSFSSFSLSGGSLGFPFLSPPSLSIWSWLAGGVAETFSRWRVRVSEHMAYQDQP